MSPGAAPPLAVISWPFQDGRPDVGTGAGAALLARDPALHDQLAAAGWSPTVQRVTAADPDAPELARTFDVLRQLAADVRGAVDAGAFPLVMAGGCLSAAATVAGAGAHGLGVVWLDAHADLDTPEDDVSGSLDLMALSALTGACWRAQRETIPGFAAVPEERVVLLGARDLAPHQRERLGTSRVATTPSAIAGLPHAVYLHVDLDVLDPSVGRANHHAAPGGLTVDEVLGVIDAAFEHGRVAAAALSAYDPGADRDGGVLAAARRIAGHIARRAREDR